jgi:putative endonuclease
MSYFVYIIKSNYGRFYIGQTSDITSRIHSHNNGLCKSTKLGAPWKIIHIEVFESRSEAMIREKQIKSYKGGKAFKKLIAS